MKEVHQNLYFLLSYNCLLFLFVKLGPIEQCNIDVYDLPASKYNALTTKQSKSYKANKKDKLLIQEKDSIKILHKQGRKTRNSCPLRFSVDRAASRPYVVL